MSSYITTIEIGKCQHPMQRLWGTFCGKKVCRKNEQYCSQHVYKYINKPVNPKTVINMPLAKEEYSSSDDE